MIYMPVIISILEVVLATIPILLVVAFVTVAERKTMGSMQRRVGPNIVGFYGSLQAFADALKLLFKEYVSPTQANIILFFLGPIMTLVFSLLGFAAVPYGPGLAVADFNLGILYLLAMASLATYGILLAGWSANSKYALLGSLRSTIQLISYELILTSAIFLVVLITNSLNLTINVEAQKAVWFVAPLFPIFCIFIIGAIAETNRAPFDLAEAESELVSGFMTEHSAVIFVFFFLAEYASIVLICLFTTILYLGGYNINYHYTNLVLETIFGNFLDLVVTFLVLNDRLYAFLYWLVSGTHLEVVTIVYWIGADLNIDVERFLDDPISANLFFSFIIAFKTSLMVFLFIWVRASFPRIRFDQLVTYCWTIMLPIVFAFIILIPCIMYAFDMLPSNLLFG